MHLGSGGKGDGGCGEIVSFFADMKTAGNQHNLKKSWKMYISLLGEEDLSKTQLMHHAFVVFTSHLSGGRSTRRTVHCICLP